MHGNAKPTYKKIKKQIIKTGIQVAIVHHINVIVRSEVCPKDRDDFYEALEEAITPHETNKHMIIITGGFNANGSGYLQYKVEIGKYWKGSKATMMILYSSLQKKGNWSWLINYSTTN